MGRQRLWPLFGALGWLAFFTASLSVPISTDPAMAWTKFASVLIGLVILMAILSSGERPHWPVHMRWGMFVAGLLFVMVPYLLNATDPATRSFVAVGLILVALPVGYWIGDRMEKATNLVPLAIAMSMADIFSVFQGPSKKAIEHLQTYEKQKEVAELAHGIGTAAGEQAARLVKAPLVDYIMVHLPQAGTGTSTPVLGIGDFIIFAFLFRAAWVHNISPVTVFIAGFISTIAAIAASNLVQAPLPALPFIALGTVGYLYATQPRMRRLEPQEIWLSVVVVAVFGALIAGKWMLAVMR